MMSATSRLSIRAMRKAFSALIFFAALNAEAGSFLPNCDKADAAFDSFLAKFTEDLAFQRSRLVYPLVVRYGNYGTSSITVQLLDKTDVTKLKDPLIYSEKERKNLDLVQEISLLQENRYAESFQVNAGEADSIRLLYKFRNISGCWYLEELHDKSL